MDWYYVNNKGESVGPVDDEAFQGLIAGGTVNSDTSVWNNGLSDWLPYSEVGLNANPESQSIVDPVEDRGPQGFQFGGIGGELFKIYLVNVLLTMVTFGIYRFWAKVKVRKYIYHKLSFMGASFDFHATGKELCSAFLKGAVVVGLAFAVYVGIGILLELFLPAIVAGIISQIIFFVAFVVIQPFIAIGKRRFLCNRSSWNSLRFRFVGTYKELFKINVKGFLFIILTLGLYLPFFICNQLRYFTDKTSYGNQGFSFSGESKAFAMIYLKGFLLSILTLGIYSFWFQAKLHRYVCGNIFVSGFSFKSNITGGKIFTVTLTNILLIICTLGIAIPWAIVNLIKLYADSTLLEGTPDLAMVQGKEDSGASALADGLSEAADALGEVFAG